MYLVATDSYDTYTKFILEHNLSPGAIAFANYNLDYLVFNPTILVIPEHNASKNVNGIISRHLRNPELAVVDYRIKLQWSETASITVSDVDYTRMYAIIKERKLTHKASITQDYRVKISFPEPETAFLLQFGL